MHSEFWLVEESVIVVSLCTQVTCGSLQNVRLYGQSVAKSRGLGLGNGIAPDAEYAYYEVSVSVLCFSVDLHHDI